MVSSSRGAEGSSLRSVHHCFSKELPSQGAGYGGLLFTAEQLPHKAHGGTALFVC